MHLEVNIGMRHEYTLNKVLLYYAGGTEKDKSGFLTEHHAGFPGRETAGRPWQPHLDRVVEVKLLEASSPENRCRYLPRNGDVCTSNAIVWWTPARKRAMFFHKEEAAAA